MVPIVSVNYVEQSASVSTCVKWLRQYPHAAHVLYCLPSPCLLLPTPVPFDLCCPLLEIRVGLSLSISHLHLADGQVICPIGVPIKAVETDASGGASVTSYSVTDAEKRGPSGSVRFFSGSSWSVFPPITCSPIIQRISFLF